MIKTKLRTILNAREAAGRLAGQALPAAVSFRIAKLINVLNAELTAYETERVKLCEKCGTLNKDEGRYDITKGEEFARELESLYNLDITLGVEKVALPDNIAITPKDIINLSEFIMIEGVVDD